MRVFFVFLETWGGGRNKSSLEPFPEWFLFHTVNIVQAG